MPRTESVHLLPSAKLFTELLKSLGLPVLCEFSPKLGYQIFPVCQTVAAGLLSHLPLSLCMTEYIFCPKEILKISEVMTKSSRFPSAFTCKIQGTLPLERQISSSCLIQRHRHKNTIEPRNKLCIKLSIFLLKDNLE